jgi:hypothetical protein
VTSFEGDSQEIVRDKRISMRRFFSEGTNALWRLAGVSSTLVGKERRS